MRDVSASTGTEAMATFNRSELEAMINASHARGVKVCAHANTAGVVEMLLRLGIDSIEHGSEIYDEPTGDLTLLRRFAKTSRQTIWVPTLAAFYTTFITSESQYAEKRWASAIASFQAALRLDMENIACGGDTGVFAHGRNALELVLMRRLGAPWERVLGWATYGGWKCVRGMEWEGTRGALRLAEIDADGVAGLVRTGFRPEAPNALERGVPFGALRAGWAADLVGVVGTLDGAVEDFEAALTTGVKFVMKGGRVYKANGEATGSATT